MTSSTKHLKETGSDSARLQRVFRSRWICERLRPSLNLLKMMPWSLAAGLILEIHIVLMYRGAACH